MRLALQRDRAEYVPIANSGLALSLYKQLPALTGAASARAAVSSGVPCECRSTWLRLSKEHCANYAQVPALAARLRPAALAAYEKSLTAVFAAGSDRRRRRREAVAKALDDAWQRLQLHSHGAQVPTQPKHRPCM